MEVENSGMAPDLEVRVDALPDGQIAVSQQKKASTVICAVGLTEEDIERYCCGVPGLCGEF